MNERTFSLDEYSTIVLGSAEPADLQWLVRRLRGEAQPVLPGYKVARRWRATQADIDTALEILHPKRVELPQIPAASSMTRTSRRRLAS